MRLALLTHEPFYPPTGGGSAEAVYLVQELVGRGHQVHVFGPPVSEPEAVTRRFGVELHPFTTWPMGRYTRWRNVKYLLYPAFLARLVQTTARRLPLDLLLSQHAISAVAAGRLKRRLRLPVVMNFLDYLTGFMETWPVWLMPPPILAALKRYELSLPRRFDADAVLTVSETLADYFQEAGFPRARLLPIHYGYDPECFPLDQRAVAARADAPPVLVMHGSLDHHHLGRIALGGLERVLAERPDTVFRVVGHRTAALKRFLAQAARRLPRARIECLGFMPYREVAPHLASGSVGLVPYEESAGTHCAFVAKVVEYLAVGLPVVCTPLNAVRRYFRHEPLVRWAGFDGPGFGEQILSWLRETPARRQAWALAASGRVRAELDWRVICRRAVARIEQAHQQAGTKG